MPCKAMTHTTSSNCTISNFLRPNHEAVTLNFCYGGLVLCLSGLNMFTINGHGANDDATIEENWDLAEDARPAMFP
jgi:hypothetical protein